MATNDEARDQASAMKAYAAAAAASHNPAPDAPALDNSQLEVVIVDGETPVHLDSPDAPPVKLARTPKPRSAAAKVLAADSAPEHPVAAKAVALKSSAAKLAVAKPKSAAPPKPAASAAPIPNSAPKAAEPITQPKRPSLFGAKPKEMIVENISTEIASTENTVTENTSTLANSFQKAVSEAQEKAKEAMEKGSAALGEVREFSRGNLDAIVASGKILAAGVREMRGSVVTEGRTLLQGMTADIKELAATRKPGEFIKLQRELSRKNKDIRSATRAKSTEAVRQLGREAFAPISGRLSLAVEKVKAARA